MNPEDNNLGPRPLGNVGLPPTPDVGPTSPYPPASQASSIYPAPRESSPTTPPPDKQKSVRKEGWRSMLSTILLFLAAPVIAVTIAAFIIQSYQVDGQSMETTLQHKDRLIVSKIPRSIARLSGGTYIPKRGEIIIFNHETSSSGAQIEAKQLIKRVIGLPGERVVVKDGAITVYSAEIPDGFNPDTETGYKIAAKQTPGDVDIVVGEDEIFVAGDNRTNSEDSRYFGPVPAEDIVGELVLRLFPIDKLDRF